jgi:isocitrate lyase
MPTRTTSGNGHPTAADRLEDEWRSSPRWRGITRRYSADEVVRLQGSLQPEHTLAGRGAQRLWHLLNTTEFVPTLGAMTGNQAVQQVKAGLQAIYLSGWQVAADANTAGQSSNESSPASRAATPPRATSMRSAPGTLILSPWR